MSSVRVAARTAPDYWETDQDDSFEPAPSVWRPLVISGGAAEPDAPESAPELASAYPDELRVEFELLADALATDALGVSSTKRLSRHPAYLAILALGDEAIPLLLERLNRPGGRPVWLTLLGALTAFQPGAGQETIEEAAEQWIRWGRRRGRVID